MARTRDGETAPVAGAGRARRRGLIGAAAVAGAGLAVGLAASRVRTMRRDGAMVPDLAVDVDLSGPGPARRVVVLGDSAGAGFGLADPEQALARRVGRALHLRDGRAVEVRSVARNGATTADVLAEQLPAAAGAEVVVVVVGVNDAVRRRPTARVAEELAALLAALADTTAPDARVVLVSCPDLSAAPGLPAVVRPVVGLRCRAVARAQAEVAAAAQVPVVAIPRRDLPPEVFGEDGYHPGVLGHERMAASVLALL